MKKLISLFLLALMLIILPLETVYAKGAVQDAKDQYFNQIKEKRQIIRQKTKALKKLELQINNKSTQVTDLYEMLFNGNMAPNEEKVKLIEAKEAELSAIIQKLIQVDKGIEYQEKAAKTNIRQQNYAQALANLDKIISLMDKEYELLQAHDANLNNFLQFIKSLMLK